MPTSTPRLVAALAAASLGIVTLTACSSGHSSAAGGTTAGPKRTTLVFTAHDEQGNMSLEDLGPHSAPGGPDIGDMLAFTQTLTRAGKAAGQVHVVAVGVDHKRHLSEATGTITTTGGTIQLAGTVSMTPRFSLAITGGTGAYAGDTGTIDFNANGPAQTLTAHLTRSA